MRDALARFSFPFKDGFAFVLMSFRFMPFIAFVIPLYLIYQRLGPGGPRLAGSATERVLGHRY